MRPCSKEANVLKKDKPYQSNLWCFINDKSEIKRKGGKKLRWRRKLPVGKKNLAFAIKLT